MIDYVISEEQIEQYGDFVEDDDNHTEEKYKNARGLSANIRSHPLSDHDAEVAKKERERVLNTLCDLCKLDECRPKYCGVDSIRSEPWPK